MLRGENALRRRLQSSGSAEILRLRFCFASRSKILAQDDKEMNL